MKKFTESRFFCLMAESSPNVERNELQIAYEEFAVSLEIKNTGESDLLFFNKQLTYTRIELDELYHNSNELGKKCAKTFFNLSKEIAPVH